MTPLISDDAVCLPVSSVDSEVGYFERHCRRINLSWAFYVGFLTFFCARFSVLTWKSVFSLFCMVVYVHIRTHGEVNRFRYLRCMVHFWPFWCKNYRNRSRFAKSVAKSLYRYCHVLMEPWFILRPSVIALLRTPIIRSVVARVLRAWLSRLRVHVRLKILQILRQKYRSACGTF